MGESWVQRIGRKYRHQLQLGACEFAAPTLFSGEEQIEKRYVGHLDGSTDAVTVGSELGLLLMSKRARPALMIANEVIGHMEGDSASDVQDQLKHSECWPVLLRVKVLARGQRTDTVVFSPMVEKSSKRG